MIKEFNYLPEEARKVRSEVFVKEQGFIDEFDEIDHISKHLVMYDEKLEIATCRIYYNEDKQSYVIGRIAVIKDYRGKSIGAELLKEADEQIKKAGGRCAMLSAQERAAGFYEKQGYRKLGEAYLDEGCPHIWMMKELV